MSFFWLLGVVAQFTLTSWKPRVHTEDVKLCKKDRKIDIFYKKNKDHGGIQTTDELPNLAFNFRPDKSAYLS